MGQILILLEFSDFLWLQLHVPLGVWVDLVVEKSQDIIIRKLDHHLGRSLETLQSSELLARLGAPSVLILVWRTRSTESCLVRIVQHYFKNIGCIIYATFPLNQHLET